VLKKANLDGGSVRPDQRWPEEPAQPHRAGRKARSGQFDFIDAVSYQGVSDSIAYGYMEHLPYP
jgi:hypothetical protein